MTLQIMRLQLGEEFARVFCRNRMRKTKKNE